MGEVKQNIDHELQDEGQFVVDDVSKIIKDAIENVIGGNGYNQSKVMYLLIQCSICLCLLQRLVAQIALVWNLPWEQ